MKLFETALNALARTSKADAAYCLKMADRFEAMGISPKQASSAICSLVEMDAVPQPGCYVATPGAFAAAGFTWDKPSASSAAEEIPNAAIA